MRPEDKFAGHLIPCAAAICCLCSCFALLAGPMFVPASLFCIITGQSWHCFPGFAHAGHARILKCTNCLCIVSHAGFPGRLLRQELSCNICAFFDGQHAALCPDLCSLHSMLCNDTCKEATLHPGYPGFLWVPFRQASKRCLQQNSTSAPSADPNAHRFHGVPCSKQELPPLYRVPS